MTTQEANGAVLDVRQALLELGLLQSDQPTPKHTQLGGGLTNDNVLVQLSVAADAGAAASGVRTRDNQLVLRRFRNGISAHLHYDREQEYSNARSAALAGIAPRLLGFVPAEAQRHGGVLAVRYVDGDVLDDDGVVRLCSSSHSIGALVHVLHRLHALPPFGNTFDPLAARKVYEQEVLRLSGAPVAWSGYEDVIRRFEPLAERLRALNEAHVPCHNDLLAANFIAQAHDGSLALIDFELSGMAPASWELGNILSENGGLEDDAEAVERLVRAYWQRDDGSDAPAWLAGRVARARAWSIVSKVTWSAWGCVLHLVHARFPTPSTFDYEAWSVERVRRAHTALHDDKAMQALMAALQPDDLDQRPHSQP